MRKRTLWIIGLLLAAVAAQAADNKPVADSKALDAKAAFDRLSTLAGEWEAGGEHKSQVTYELIAGGSALVERESMEGHAPMMTVYHLDGDSLMLTHYCMAGNQPRMRARSFDAATGEIRFEFLDATNLSKSPGHMHNATMHVADKDHLNAAWDFYEGGQKKSTEVIAYKRVR